MKIVVFELFLCLLNLLCIVNCINYDISSGSFDDLNIVLSPNRLNASDCPEILKNLKVSVIFTNLKKVISRHYFTNVLFLHEVEKLEPNFLFFLTSV